MMRDYNKDNGFVADEGVVFAIEPPRENDKPEQAAEQMLASIHGILLHSSGEKKGFFAKPENRRISLEIVCNHGDIYFLIWTPTEVHNDIKEQILAQYPQANTLESDMRRELLTAPLKHTNLSYSIASQKTSKELPIRTLQSFDVDPLAAITAAMVSGAGKDTFTMIQLIISPRGEDWQKGSLEIAKSGSKGKGIGLPPLNMLWQSPQTTAASSEPSAESELDQIRSKAIIEKSHKSAYDVTMRLVSAAESPAIASSALKSLSGAFSQFHMSHLNSFSIKQVKSDSGRAAIAQRLHEKTKMLLGIEELAGIFHLPHSNVETPGIVWAKSNTSEPPMNLPLVEDHPPGEVAAIGKVRFRGKGRAFGLLRQDRARHMYVLGQTGTGKSYLLEGMATQDVVDGHGIAIIDPHGDFARGVISRIPAERVNDVIYFNPTDGEYPVAFNPMECEDPSQRDLISSELIGVFKRMFDSWGPRLEYILRYTILALLERDGTTMLDITRLLTDKAYRKETLTYVTDPVVLNFWNVEFASWNDKFQAEAISPVLNKIGAFVSNGVVRQIVARDKSSFNIRKAMDEGKILIANLSRGAIGEDNAAVLGALLVTKIQLAAMSRVDIPRIEDRRPFYLYVDEFQNFATDSFATILSEARKFALNLTVANQYIEQMEESVRSAIFGNVGSKLILRVGADDASQLARYFEPFFSPADISGLSNRDFITQLSIKGESTKPFSGSTLELDPPKHDYYEHVVYSSRVQYGRNVLPPSAFDQTPKSATRPAKKKPKGQGPNHIKVALGSQPLSPANTNRGPIAPTDAKAGAGQQPTEQQAPKKKRNRRRTRAQVKASRERRAAENNQQPPAS